MGYIWAQRQQNWPLEYVGDERVVSGYMEAFNRNGEAWGRSRYHVGMGVWTKSCVLAELYLRYFLNIHKNIKSKSH